LTEHHSNTSFGISHQKWRCANQLQTCSFRICSGQASISSGKKPLRRRIELANNPVDAGGRVYLKVCHTQRDRNRNCGGIRLATRCSLYESQRCSSLSKTWVPRH